MFTDMINFARSILPSLAFNETVFVLTPTITTDSVNQPLEDWTAPTSVQTTGRIMEPGYADRRTLDDLNIASAAYVIGLPYGVTVTAQNRLLVNGNSYVILRATQEGTQVIYTRCLCYLPSS